MPLRSGRGVYLAFLTAKLVRIILNQNALLLFPAYLSWFPLPQLLALVPSVFSHPTAQTAVRTDRRRTPNRNFPVREAGRAGDRNAPETRRAKCAAVFPPDRSRLNK